MIKNNIICAILSIAIYSNDWKKSQDTCLKFLWNSDTDISAVAATCIGHIARIHRNIDRIAFDALVERAKSDDRIDTIQDALDDISIYVKSFADAEGAYK